MMRRPVAIANLVLLFLQTTPVGANSTADSSSCFGRASLLLKRNQIVTIRDRNGESVRGRYLFSDPEARTLSINAYDPASDRFGRRQFEESVLDRIEWKETTESIVPSLALAAALGAVGLTVGLGISEDRDYGTETTRQAAPFLLATLGVFSGFLLGGLAVLPGRKTTERAIDCSR